MSNTFTIEQTPDSTNLFIYPDSSSATEWIAVGNTENYETIDDTIDGADTSTYNYTTSNSVVSDWFGIPNQSNLGTINHVTIYTRTKSQTYPQASSGTFEILYADGFGNETRSSDATYGTDITLGTSYDLYSVVYTSRPSDGVTWTWDDIDNMLIGYEGNSPETSNNGTTDAFDSNGDGDTTTLTPLTGSSHYAMIQKENPPDDEDTYNYMEGGSGSREDLYNLEDHDPSDHVGDINSVTWWARIKDWGTSGSYYYPWLKIYTSEHQYGSFPIPGADEWNYVSKEFTSNPSNSSDWTWDDIDNLQVGIIFADNGSGAYCGISQCYAIVNYDFYTNPQIRVTQCYAKVNYTPNATSLTLNQPIKYTFGHSREIKKLNFWNGDRSVYDVQRNSKYVSMDGVEYDTASSEATVKMEDMKDFLDNGTHITISGLNDNNVNGDWIIKDFSWNRDTNNHRICKWTMSCEAKT